MNTGKLHDLINFYVKNEEKIHVTNVEGYKWDIYSSVRGEILSYVDIHYRDGKWDKDFTDFYDFIKNAIDQTGNLVYSGSKSVIRRAANKYPEKVRQMFIDLSGFNSDTTLENRVVSFVNAIEAMAKDDKDISSSGRSFHTDFRSVSVYLLMMQPKTSYNYMYTYFENFAKFVELEIPRSNDVQILLKYFEVCDEIGSILRKKHNKWFEDYLDNEIADFKDGERYADIYGHILVQDVIFSLYYYNHPEDLEGNEDDIVKTTKFRKEPIQKTVTPDTGTFVDYEAKQRRNRAIGAAAEYFVYENERRAVKSYGFDPDLVKHTSKDEGDGIGYDIRSLDKNGNEIYIEVKATRGYEEEPFYITENELQCSILNSDKYRLYRVYDFKTAGTTGRGKIAVIEGSLEKYCINPVSYIAVFSK